MSSGGMVLLQDVAERIIARWLERRGYSDVRLTHGMQSFGGHSVDIVYTLNGTLRKIKVKPDPYYGTDPVKAANRSLGYYRPDASAYAFESVADSTTRAPGWAADSAADDLFYYFLAISQTEEEVSALMNEPDEVFFSELAVERDQLVCLPMGPAREWFDAHAETHTPRPVMVGGAIAWYRLVPRKDVEQSLPGINVVGPIFSVL